MEVIALGKGKARTKQDKEKIYYFTSEKIIKNISLTYDQADKIFLQLRNEAHRYANTYREKQMSKERK
jgi:excinuclease UvrABC nuclease subunit